MPWVFRDGVTSKLTARGHANVESDFRCGFVGVLDSTKAREILVRPLIILTLAAALSSVPLQSVLAQPTKDQLLQGFLSPPDSAKPLVWWHWMNGNVTQRGIELDLEWMHRIGIGGIQSFDASFDTPQVVSPRVVFMTPGWKAAFAMAAKLADRFGMELAIAGSPGFSESGGPWVKPEQAMKKVVWSEIQVLGGRPIPSPLPLPPHIAGPFQDEPVDRSKNSRSGPPPIMAVPDLYRDVAVIGFRIPNGDRTMTELHPVVSSNAGKLDVSQLWDGRYSRAAVLPDNHSSTPPWIRYDFGSPQVIQSMSIGLQDFGSVAEPRHFGAELESSVDGTTYHHVAYAYDSAGYVAEGIQPVQQTVTFEPVKARYFRVRFPAFPPTSPSLSAILKPLILPGHRVTEFVLYTSPRVDHFEEKAGYFLNSSINSHATRPVALRDVVRRRDIVNLTSHMRSDGTINWTPPQGRWAILRIGYSLLAITNSPASPEATGLEVDKLSRASVRSHMGEYLGRFESFLKPNLMGPHGLRAMVTDSWEAGAQNWTDDLPSQFLRRRGYDIYPWLPALTGWIISSAHETDQFLWDFRRTLAELVAENHFGEISAALHSRGMTYYGEAHEASRAFIGDGMDAKRHDDIPMGAMWMPGALTRAQEQCDADIHESASVAHIYGKDRVAAESMTAVGISGDAYAFSPESLKPTADRELVDGVNLFVLHTSVHQPLPNGSPGITLGSYGQWFTRHETWAEQATPWVTYLARSSYLLQQGRFVADILYYYGQDSNITAMFPDSLPQIPQGYAFDFASPSALAEMSVEDGAVVTRSGMRYRILVLDPRVRFMSLDVARTIAKLVQAGATVLGSKPRGTPSLADNPGEFDDIVNSVWGFKSQRVHSYGKGRVLSGLSIADATLALDLTPDFTYTKSHPDALLWFAHRHLESGEIYFVDNRRDRAELTEGRFRVTDMAPEIWHADTGVTQPAEYHQEGGHTVVPLHLEPNDALFVVFRKHTTQRQLAVPVARKQLLGMIGGQWTVSFQKDRGAPAQAVFSQLNSWTENPNPGIRYFSGTADYETALTIPVAWLANGQRVEVDLGKVRELAEILVNGRSAGITWKAPFRLDITDFLRPGHNSMSVRVSNLWPNRLIGDKQPKARVIASTTFNPYSAHSPLRPSGLLGPVSIWRVAAPQPLAMSP